MIVALVLSVLLHLFGGAVYDYGRHLLIASHLLRAPVAPKQSTGFVATSDLIHIEKRTVPRRATPARPHPPQRSRPQRRPVPVVAQAPALPVARTETPRPLETARPELAHETKKPAPALAPRRTSGPPQATPQPKAAEQKKSAELTPAEIAKLDSQFEQTIRASREDAASVIDKIKEPAGGQKPYALNLAGEQARLTHIEGSLHVVSARMIDRTHILYVVRYRALYPDGHVETDIFPWPFIYPVDDDQFARGGSGLFVQPPPPDFRPTRPLTPIEKMYYSGP